MLMKLYLTVLLSVTCGTMWRVADSKRYGTVSLNVKEAPDRGNDPFEQFASFLIQSSKSDGAFDKYSNDEVRRSVKKLSAGQEALKTMDGAAHRLRSSFSDSTSSLSVRYNKFMTGERKKLKEAGKLYEYVTTVERSLQAAEILQAVGNKKEKERAKWMKAAGLIEIRRITVTKNKLRCVLSVMQPIPESVTVLSESSSSSSSSGGTGSVNDEGADGLQTSAPIAKKSKSQHDVVPRFSAGDLVLGFMDDCPSDSTGSGSGELSVRELLCSMTQEGEQLSLNSVGLVAEEVTVQPVLLSMAVQALTQLTDLIAPAPAPEVQEDEAEGEGGANIDDEEHVTASNVKSTSKSTNIDINADGAGTAIGEGEGEEEGGGVESAEESMPILSAAGLPLPSKITIVGHSAGGAVGAYTAMVLEGFLNSTGTPLMRTVQPLVGLYAGRVSCICLGPPPCVSRAVVPRFIRTIVSGDDVVPRASPQSLDTVKTRVLKALKAGAGEKMGLRWKVGSAWLKDLQSVAGGSHDLSALSIPGRVFFIKNRKLNEGASMQRVLRGQWREDILWTLHEVLLSKRMIDHHALEEHIKTLSRC